MGIFSSILPSKEEKRLRELRGRLDSLKDRVPEEGKEGLRGALALIQHAGKLIRRGDKEGASKALESIEVEISRLEVLVGEYIALKKTVTGAISELLETPGLREVAVPAPHSSIGNTRQKGGNDGKTQVLRYIDHARRNHVAVLLDESLRPVATDSVVSMVMKLNTQPIGGKVLIVPTVVTDVLVELAKRRGIETVIGREVEARVTRTGGVRVLTFDSYLGGH
ncbi:hypothetical protein CL1_1719 [Thermococcus cleftensis]|uniref:Uncharacterized protein n=1 Tax=Thermococcus cleftensis (strain DSM 27260 / KACC 17922 / CL1) TaxID=163003 RepID=I3ZW32_THECF|nr:hypothetical protein [Thermococcus cleftensis]AFL95916.1 hypothetical protein CL1_1719 [Thermococcus cleftensis]